MNIRLRELDANNELRLRTRLPDFDRKLISLAALEQPVSLSVSATEARLLNNWHKKAAREYIYRAAVEHYEFDMEILPAPQFDGHVDRSRSTVQMHFDDRKFKRGEGPLKFSIGIADWN